MNVYVESNFVLELALLQEQHAACEEILEMCAAREISLVLPAYSLMEPYGTVMRRQGDRKRVKAAVDGELRQLARTAVYTERLQDLERATRLLLDSAEEDLERLESVRSRLLECAEIVPLDQAILARAPEHQARHSLSAPDAVVYASVLSHLERSSMPASCFLNRDAGFSGSAIAEDLRARSCKFLRGFDQGLQFLRGTLNQETPA